MSSNILTDKNNGNIKPIKICRHSYSQSLNENNLNFLENGSNDKKYEA